MSLEAWLKNHLGYEIPRPRLERIRAALGLFDLDFSNKKIITVGGTNGKGQTSRELYKMALNEAECALWTSPHLVSVTERFSKNGVLAEAEELQGLFDSSLNLLRKKGIKLSYYEFLFLVFLRFSSECPLLILEVGLGGRFDAVNVLDADIVLLTSISRDHQEYLGPRLDGILAEKIALARSGKKLVTNFELSYLRGKASAFCQDHRIEHLDLFAEGVCSKADSYSARNRKLAIHCAQNFFGKSFTQAGGKDAPPLIEFTVGRAVCHGLPSHNPDGVRKGVQFLNDAKYTNFYKLVLLSFSNRRLEDAMTMIKTVKLWKSQSGSRWDIALASFEHPKAMGRAEIEMLALKAQVNFVDDTKKLFKKYNSPGDKVLVLGSNYFIGDLCSQSPISD